MWRLSLSEQHTSHPPTLEQGDDEFEFGGFFCNFLNHKFHTLQLWNKVIMIIIDDVDDDCDDNDDDD